jgi:hypothetical protein
MIDRKNWFFMLFVTVIIFLNIVNIIKESPQQIHNLILYIRGDRDAGYSEDWIRFYQAADWLKKNSPENSIVVSRKPALVYLRARRKGLGYPFTYNTEKVKSVIFSSEVDYIIVDRFYWTNTTFEYLVPVLNQNRDKFDIVYTTPPPQTYVIKVKDSLN